MVKQRSFGATHHKSESCSAWLPFNTMFRFLFRYCFRRQSQTQESLVWDLRVILRVMYI